MKDDKYILDKLVRINKPLLILAGPGMGKTHALAYKMKYLIKEEEVGKDEITVITFTNEAAINMRKKISLEGDETYIEPERQPSVICTMHKLCHGIIKNYYSKVGLNKGFKVVPSQNLKEILIKDCAQIVGGKRKDGEETIICRQRGKCDETFCLKCIICSQYTELMRRFNYIDHDDQISLASKLLREDEYILKKEQRGAKYLLVDEYQDINYAQWELIKLLSKGNTDNLLVVGDDYQSIYGFRGGDPEYIRNFGNDYAPDAVIQHLLTSWRCPPNILKGAFYMVHKYNGGDIKILDKFAFKNKSDAKIKVGKFPHHNPEAGFIAWQIKEIGPSYDVLILVPRLSYTSPIKRELRKNFIDFSCEYDLEKTDLYLINILLNWLKNPANNFDLRILIEEIINRAASDIPALQTEFRGKEETRKKREDAFKQISNFWKEVGEGKTLYSKIKTLKENEQFKKLVEVITTLRNAHELKTDIIRFISEAIDKLKIWRNIQSFSEELNSAIEEIKNLTIPSGECSVRILTMKKAKGLQADYVFIVGMENNILPRENASDADKQEDSRLLYVSMTRAKKELYLLHSETRDRDITKVEIGQRSEFIDVIPPQYIEEIN
jgi:DNA helicase-2/ATP-dependent DNA helicase PcrA